MWATSLRSESRMTRRCSRYREFAVDTLRRYVLPIQRTLGRTCPRRPAIQRRGPFPYATERTGASHCRAPRCPRSPSCQRLTSAANRVDALRAPPRQRFLVFRRVFSGCPLRHVPCLAVGRSAPPSVANCSLACLLYARTLRAMVNPFRASRAPSPCFLEVWGAPPEFATISSSFLFVRSSDP
jgi:hypothetical protein